MNYICITDPLGKTEMKRVDDLLVRSIDGIICLSYKKQPEVLEKLRAISKHTPVVCRDGMMIGEDLSYVCADGRKGTLPSCTWMNLPIPNGWMHIPSADFSFMISLDDYI